VKEPQRYFPGRSDSVLAKLSNGQQLIRQSVWLAWSSWFAQSFVQI